MLDEIFLRARWLFPITSRPIPNAVIACRAGRIVSLNAHSRFDAILDLGHVALLPALVNTHTHLEFSELAAPFNLTGAPSKSNFPNWIHQVIAWRAAQPADAEIQQANRHRATAAGLQEAMFHGTGAIGEIATAGWPEDCFQQPPPFVTVFREFIGLAAERGTVLMEAARKHVARQHAAAWNPGLSPHAPYTVCWELLQQLCDLSRASRTPVAMHLAETPDELELLATHGGAFRKLLDELGVWRDDAFPRGSTPRDYLEQLAAAHRAIVVHGNFLNDDDHQFLAARRERMSVAYCPRTHAYFDHTRYPLRKMLDTGVRLCLGTDSRASNPDLSLWNEMGFVAATHSDVSPAEILHMGTLAGAEALGVESDFGSLGVGKRALFTLVPLPERETGDPYADLFAAADVQELLRLCEASGDSGSADEARRE